MPASLPSPALLFAALAALSATVVAAMTRVGVLDRPGARSSHTRPTPKGGGVGVVLATLAGLAIMPASAPPGVLVGAIAIAVVSFLDDWRDFRFTVKLAAQLLAALLAIASGLVIDRIQLPGLGVVPLSWLGPLATLAWILFATNAMNFIDGINGLAGGVSLLACAALAWLGAWQGSAFIATASLAMAAGLAGFLPFNYPRARIFLGDVGSQFCGFMLAILGIAAGRFEAVPLSVLFVPMLLAGVLFDVAFTLLRRARAGERVTEAHRSHLYQLATRAGMPAARVTLVEWGFTLWGAFLCAAMLAVPAWARPLVALLVLLPQFAWLMLVRRLSSRAGLAIPYL